MKHGPLMGRSNVDPIEVALAAALTEAAAAGQFDVVAQLARELELRRRAPSAPPAFGKLVVLAPRRR